MKHFLIILLLCAPSIYAQNPLKGEWITSSLLRDFKEEYKNLFVLTQREGERVGYATEFEKNDKNQYISYYFAPCGNDCFSSITGTFKLIAPSYVRLNALTFEQTVIVNTKTKSCITIPPIITYTKSQIRKSS